MEASYPKALGARKDIVQAWLSILPVSSSTCIEQDGDEEEIEKALFRGEVRCGGDLYQGSGIEREKGYMGRVWTSVQCHDAVGEQVLFGGQRDLKRQRNEPPDQISNLGNRTTRLPFLDDLPPLRSKSVLFPLSP